MASNHHLPVLETGALPVKLLTLCSHSREGTRTLRARDMSPGSAPAALHHGLGASVDLTGGPRTSRPFLRRSPPLSEAPSPWRRRESNPRPNGFPLGALPPVEPFASPVSSAPSRMITESFPNFKSPLPPRGWTARIPASSPSRPYSVGRNGSALIPALGVVPRVLAKRSTEPLPEACGATSPPRRQSSTEAHGLGSVGAHAKALLAASPTPSSSSPMPSRNAAEASWYSS